MPEDFSGQADAEVEDFQGEWLDAGGGSRMRDLQGGLRRVLSWVMCRVVSGLREVGR